MAAVKQGERGVTVFRVLPLPAVLLQEKWRVFLELVQFSECVIQAERQALPFMRQGIVGVIVWQTRMGLRQRGARRGVIWRRPPTSLWHHALPGARRHILLWQDSEGHRFLQAYQLQQSGLPLKLFTMFRPIPDVHEVSLIKSVWRHTNEINSSIHFPFSTLHFPLKPWTFLLQHGSLWLLVSYPSCTLSWCW